MISFYSLMNRYYIVTKDPELKDVHSWHKRLHYKTLWVFLSFRVFSSLRAFWGKNSPSFFEFLSIFEFTSFLGVKTCRVFQVSELFRAAEFFEYFRVSNKLLELEKCTTPNTRTRLKGKSRARITTLFNTGVLLTWRF